MSDPPAIAASIVGGSFRIWKVAQARTSSTGRRGKAVRCCAPNLAHTVDLKNYLSLSQTRKMELQSISMRYDWLTASDTPGSGASILRWDSCSLQGWHTRLCKVFSNMLSE